MADKRTRSRPRIALVIGQMAISHYAQVLWPAVADAAEKRDVDLFILHGEAPFSPNGFDEQNNVVYDLLSAKVFDGLVIAAGTLCNYMNIEDSERYFRRFQKFKAVTLGVQMPGFPAVLVDNRSGVLETVSHLAEFHGYRRIAYISGFESNSEARIRRDAFLEALKQNGLPVMPDLMYEGDFFQASGTQAMQHFLQTRGSDLEAVVCANDDMAIGVLDFLEQKRIRVPQDMAVVGFDNIDEVRFHPYCPMTTVRQPIREQALLALDMVLGMIETGKPAESVVLPTRLVVRTSCGCPPRTHDPADEQETRHAEIARTRERKAEPEMKTLFIEDAERNLMEERCGRLLSYFQDASAEPDIRKPLADFNRFLTEDIRSDDDVSVWQSVLDILAARLKTGNHRNAFPGFVREARAITNEKILLQQAHLRLRNISRMEILLVRVIQNLINALSVPDLLNTIATELPALSIPRFFVSLYPRPLRRERSGASWALPPDINLVLAYETSGRVPLHSKTVPYPTQALLPPEFLNPDRRQTMVVKTLYFREVQFGFLFLELGWRNGPIYGALQLQISAALNNFLPSPCKPAAESRHPGKEKPSARRKNRKT